MQYKNKMRYHLIPAKWFSSINQETTSSGKDLERGEHFSIVVRMQTGAATVESSMEISQKIKNGSAF